MGVWGRGVDYRHSAAVRTGAIDEAAVGTERQPERLAGVGNCVDDGMCGGVDHRTPRQTEGGDVGEAAGNNYSDNGVPADLPSGGEALLHAESLSVPDFVGVMNDVKNGEINTHGRVIDGITDDQQERYCFESDFPEASSGGRVMLLLSHP